MTLPLAVAGEDGYLTVHGLRHHYIRWGDRRAEPLVFLHGLMNNARYWEHIAQRFAGRHAVYAPDLRGHGESEHAPGGYLVWAFAMDLRGIVEELDFEAFDLVTHGIGARVGVAYARDHSHRLRHLALADMALEPAAAAPAGERAGFASEAEALAYFARLYPAQPPDFLARQIAASLVTGGPGGRLAFRFDPAIEQATGRAATVEVPYLWESLEHIHCPTLVVRAERGSALPGATAREIVRRLPKGLLVELPGASDDVALHEPDAFSAAVRAFLGQ